MEKYKYTMNNNQNNSNTETAIFAGGCFWGVEHLMKTISGTISIEVGYIGGRTVNPSYQEVCTQTTGHAEAVRIIFNPGIVSFETLAKLFFEIHDPTQIGGQGPDIGDQYRSEIFYTTPQQKEVAEKLIKILEDRGYSIATKLTEATEFYTAEDYHQDYYNKKGSKPYCHIYTKRF